MTRLNRLGVCVLAAAWFSCANLEDDSAALGAEAREGDGAEDPESVESPAEGRLVLTFHADGGARVPSDTFPGTEAVYLGTQITDARAQLAEGDFAFVVVNADGGRVSTDAIECRRFHIDRSGRITEVYMGLDIDGAQCRHGSSAAGGALVVQLAPFSAAGGGAVEYTVLVARVGDVIGGKFPDSAARGSFVVQSPAQAACGDGGDGAGDGDDSDCDDGSTLTW
jgi:hypothetical protein